VTPEERLAKLETEVHLIKELTQQHRSESRAAFDRVDAGMAQLARSLGDLTRLRDRGTGVLWVLTGLTGTGVFGVIVGIWDYFVRRGGH
jgi:NCAIR mutase (PurE)-related protein